MILHSSSLTVGELTAELGGVLRVGDPDTLITGVASLAEGSVGDLSFYGDPRYLKALRRSGASAVLIARDLPSPSDFSGALIEVDKPAAAFAGVVARFTPPPVVDRPGIAPTALLGRDVTLGANVSVGPYVVIEDGVTLGANVVIGAFTFLGEGSAVGEDSRLYPRVTVRERCLIGRRAIIHPGVVIGGDGFGFETKAGVHHKVPQTGIVQIDDDVEIGANTTIDRARFGRTHISKGTKIDNLVQLAHNVVVGPHGLICAQAGISGSTRLGHHVTVAGQVGTVGHIEIGDEAILAAKAGIVSSVPPKLVMWGYPAAPLNEAKESFARVRRLPKLIERVKQLEAELAALKAALTDKPAAPGGA